jgi:hypothetical protein
MEDVAIVAMLRDHAARRLTDGTEAPLLSFSRFMIEHLRERR